MKRLLVASRNTGKVGEIRALLDSIQSWRIESLPEHAPDVEEVGLTFLENAIQKSEFYGAQLGGWTLADDSGLEVDALGGRPGIYSARYAATDDERNSKLLRELNGVPERLRGARYVCALALSSDGRTVWSVEERVEGKIVPSPVGTHGFGYDPLFWVPEFQRTMAQLSPPTKNRISHRGRALARLREHLEQIGSEPDRDLSSEG